MQAQTGAENVSESNLIFVFHVLHPFQFLTFAPATWRNCFLSPRSPQHPRVNSKNWEVSGFPLHHTDLRQLPPGVWHCAVVIGAIIFFIVAPAATPSSDSSSLDSLLDQSNYDSSEEPDSDNVDPEDGCWQR